MLPTYHADRDILLEPCGTWPRSVHRFDKDTISALLSAEAAGRPLLLRGWPGTGKSQAARAAAAAVRPQRLFVSIVIDGRTEAQDLLWRYDAVGRLSDAHTGGSGAKPAEHYVSPGPLWWAYNWDKAFTQWNNRKHGDVPDKPEGWQPEHGTVLLIDEIDKADPDLPNAFLEVLGNQAFSVPIVGQRVVAGTKPPLVIITTNEERELPPAFLRRCFVHVLQPPADLVEYGWLHLKRRGLQGYDKVLQDAANLIREDQRRANLAAAYAPGLAEYLDLVVALAERANTETGQKALLREVSRYVLHKDRALSA